METFTKTPYAPYSLEIVRLEPGDQSVSFDCRAAAAYDSLRAEILTSDGQVVRQTETKQPQGHFTVTGLDNGTDYRLRLTAVCAGRSIEAQVRIFRCGHFPGAVINYIHPDDHTYMPSGRSPASPSLLRLPSGRLLASHDVFWGGCDQNLSFVFASDDNGVSWQYLSRIYPCFWGKLFLHDDSIYMLGMSAEYGALLIFRSEDGINWSAPSELIPGGDRDRGGPHKAPMPVISHHGRLWTAIDYGSWSLGGHANGLISAGYDADLMDPAQWVCTGFLPYNSDWPGTSRGKSGGCLEGNAVVAPDGRLFNLLRYQTNGCRPQYGRAILLEADPGRPDAPLRFAAVIDFPGNLSKFKVDYDPQTRLYYAIVSRVTSEFLSQRNVLTLTSSPDLIHWRIERDILNYMDNGWPEPVDKVGFQYVDWIYDGPDILALSRTALNGAWNYHNANALTVHRIHHFRL
ncbi:MAG: sialidase family protein [Bacillota bacterium]|nr:sialidase family protein [Bacillota bacterium]